MCIIPCHGKDAELKITDKFIRAVAMLESGGVRNPNQAVGDNGKSNGAYQIQSDAWDDCNRRLRKQGKPTTSYRDGVNHPQISKVYCRIYLEIVRDSLLKVMPRDVMYVDVYCAYNMGVRGYLRACGEYKTDKQGKQRLVDVRPDKHPHQHQLSKLIDAMRK